MLRKIADILIAFGPWGVFPLGFVDSLGVPLPAVIDALLIGVAIEAPRRAYFTALMAVLGSAGGNLILFLMSHSAGRRFLRAESPGERRKFRRWFHRYGLLTVFVPAVVPFVPLPLKVFVVSAGVMHTPAGKFLAVILLARAIRYFGVAYAGVRLGGGAQAFLMQNAWTIVGIALAIALTAVALMRLGGGHQMGNPKG